MFGHFFCNNGNGIFDEERTDFSVSCVIISVSAPTIQI
jgi:hypothetical protein